MCQRVSVLTEYVNAIQAKILKELLADGRKTDTEIAKKIGLTKEAVKKNFLQLEEIGIITGATIHVNYKSFGFKAVAHILINIDSQQAEKLVKHLQRMPEVYSYYCRGLKGNIDVLVILKTLEQLNDIKDSIKRCFSILEMRTAIWTDVKEMNENLSIILHNLKDTSTMDHKTHREKSNTLNVTIDEIDQKIADRLAENGRISMNILGRAVGVSPDTAKRRYEKMKKDGVLKVTIQINPSRIGYQALCIFFATTSNEKSDLIVDKISNIPNIISVMKTSGDYDLQIYAMIQDIGQLLYIQEQIGNIPGISRIEAEILKFGEEWKKWPSPRQYISTF
jgi:Lrp/AsnC family transcriptional regulator, leucine-responsive regulatory protein